METRKITITPAAARMLALPATPELRAGWTGPVEMLWPHNGPPTWEVAGIIDGRPMYAIWEDLPTRLPLSRREVVHRVIDVAGLGVPCPACGATTRREPEGDRPGCHGWLRPPADLTAFRAPIAAEGWTSAELSAALVWLSWVRLAAGMKPIAALATRSVDGCYLVWPPYPGLRTPDPSFAMLVYGPGGPTLTATIPASATP